MKIPYKKLKAIISAFLAVAVAAQSAPAVFADSSEKEPEASVAIPVYGEPSVYGEQDVYYIDENGEEITFDLIPERYEQYDYDRALPVSYNLVDDGFVSSVKDQSSTGTCWAHSALAAAESSLIKDGLAGMDIDFSEAHLVWFSQGQDAPADSPLYGESLGIGSDCYSNGGNIYVSIGALSAWVGAANESDYANVTARPSLAESMRFDSEYHLQNAVIFDKSDTQSIKSYLMDNGALTISYHSDKNHYKYGDGYTSFYQNDYTTTNHAVAVVGWDDTFSKDNFIVTPPGDGAWIIKNSWGTTFGTDGYFYLSYYDTSINRIASFELERNTNYDKVYQHSMYVDPGIYYPNNSITGANVFTASADDSLAAVAFFTSDASVPYTISIYEGVSETNPMSGTLLHTQSGTATYAGYHTIDLDKTVSVHNGNRFSVCVALDKVGTRMALDRKAINSGDSFYTYGVGTSSSKWKDAMDGNFKNNMVIRAFTVSDAPVVKAPALPEFSAAAGDKQVTLTWNAVENAVNYKVCYRLSDAAEWTEKETTETSYTVTGLTNGQKYDFVVLAGNEAGWSQWTSNDIISVVSGATPKEAFQYSIYEIAGYAVITDYIGEYSEVIIPSSLEGYPVTSIGSSAFEWCTNVTSVIIPDGVMYIESGAFKKCSGLESITIPKTVESIGSSAFLDCASLKNITIPSGVASIEYETFSGCSGLESIIIPDSVKTIGDNAFYCCTGLKNVTLSANLSSLGDFSFYTCYALESITIPDSVNSIGTKAFSGCSELKLITLGSKISNIGENAFPSNENIKFKGELNEYTINYLKQYGLYNENDSYTVNFPEGIKVRYNDGFIDNGGIVNAGDEIFIGTDLENYIDHIVKVNGEELELSANSDGYYCVGSVAVNEDITITFEASKWSAERMSDYVSLEADEDVRAYWYNNSLQLIPDNKAIQNGNYIGKGSYICIKVSAELYPEMPIIGINGMFYESALNEDNDWQLVYCVDVPDNYLRIEIDSSSGIPSTPTNVKAVAGDSQVTLSWGAVEDAVSYRIYLYNGSCSKIGETSETSYTATKLVNGTEYKFLVLAYNGSHESNYTEENIVSATPNKPEKPTILGIKPGENKVKLEWKAVTGAEMYRVYTYDNGTYTRRFTCDGSRTIATVTDLKANVKYGFVVSAKVNGTWTDYSDKADLVYATPTAPVEPVVVKPAITAYKPGNYKVKLEWKAVEGAEMYRVYTYENGAYTRKFTCLGSRNVATVTSLVSGVKLGFVVSAKVGGTWTDYTDKADLVYATPTGDPAPVITGTKGGDGKVKISWHALSGAEMYRVYTCENGAYTRKFTCNGSTNVATVTGLTNGKEYAFVVSAKVGGVWTNYKVSELLVYATPNA